MKKLLLLITFVVVAFATYAQRSGKAPTVKKLPKEAYALTLPEGRVQFSFEKNKILVKFRDGLTKDDIARSFAQTGYFKAYAKDWEVPFPKVIKAELKEQNTKTYEQIVAELESNPDVLYTAPVLLYQNRLEQALYDLFYVKLRSSSDLNLLRNYATANNFTIEKEYEHNIYFCRVTKASAGNSFEIAAYLQSLNQFEFAEPDFIYTCQNTTNDPSYVNQWAINNTGQYSGTPGADMDIENAWYLTTGVSSVKVAIIDCFGSAAQFTHPDITFSATHDATGTGFTSTGFAGDAHGINCAGIIKATANNGLGSAGVAYNANVVAVKVGTQINSQGNWNSTGNSISDGLTWAYQNCDIISNSNSFGSSSSLVNNAIANAITLGRAGKGSPVFSSAGNNNSTTIGYPASNANTIAVVASSPCDKRKSPTSCDGENWWGSDYGTGADVAAPGVIIASTDIAGSAGYSSGDYSSAFNGTSAACPMAAAVMALILSEKPSLTYTNARFALESTCEKVGGYAYNSNISGQPNGTWSTNMGYGRVNAYAALQTICTSSNDECASAITLPVGSSCNYMQGSVCGATQSMAPITCGSFTASSALDVWYEVTPTLANVTLKCDGGAGADVVLSLYSGACGSLSLLQCSDVTGTGGIETINATGLTAGVTYYVRVYNYNGNSNGTNFEICASCFEPNDLCSNATPLSVGTTCNYVTGNLCGATQTLAPLTCTGFTSSAALDVWYSVTPGQAGGGMTIKCQSGPGADVVLAVYSGTCGNPTLITCADGSGSAGLETISLSSVTPGVTYYVRVYNYNGNGAGTSFQICASCSESNDDCIAATSLPIFGSCSYTAGNLCGATQSIAPISCNGFQAATAKDVWYTITPSASNVVIKCQGGSSVDMIMGLYSGSCGALNLIQCSDATAGSGMEVINASGLTVGATYYIRLYDFNGNIFGTDFQICAMYDAPVVTQVAQTSLCQGSTVLINYTVATAYGAGNVFTAQLSNSSGSFANPVNIGSWTSTASGVISCTIPAAQAPGNGYRIRVVSSNPAVSGPANSTNLTVLAMPTQAQVAITPTGAVAFCTGYTVTISVPSTAGYTYQWKLQGFNIGGATNSSYDAGVTGAFTVVATNPAGCSRSSLVKNITENALPSASVTPSAMQNLCPGQTTTLQANSGPGYTYAWIKDNVTIPGATNISYTTGTPGTYMVQVTKANGCFAYSNQVVVTNACAGVVSDTGNLTLCTGSSFNVNFVADGFNAGNIFTLQLSDVNGSFATPTDIGNVAGTSNGIVNGTIPLGTPIGVGYKVRIASSDPVTYGAASPLTIKVQSADIDPVELCAVTVNAGKNLLIWDKPLTANIDTFVIYRNTQVTGVYQRIAAQAYGVFSTYQDNASDPATQPYRYYIAGKNLCAEGPGGQPHRTIHLTINKGQGTTKWNLIWNGYEGFSHGTYQIWRGTTAANMALLTEVEANMYNSFTDLSAPTGALFYKVVIGDAPSCNPSAKTTGGDYISSNIVSNEEASLNLSWMDMNIWPNPGTTSSQLIILSNSTDEIFSVRIVDITGRVLDRYEAQAEKAIEFGNRYAPGVYTIEATSKTGQKLVKKWIKQ